ncbi:MAG: hypothetical protein HC767_00170 [Akkermansiaceae bacterium]|nr:hypothetical protein [Akkermansiaceae bacterium]
MCYSKLEIQAVKAEAEELRRQVQDARSKAGAEEEKLAAAGREHAEQLLSLTAELTAVKTEWEATSKLQSQIYEQELAAAIEAAVLAAELRVREEEAEKRQDLLAQVRACSLSFLHSVSALRSVSI